ncbi:serine/threonine protein phosphatase [Leptospira langatensis]|uniref:Serine/threonine protein phosphatase n=1 Tax=Leptospira langatensis TaxID=2484983 RepID=A0A5F1ZU48_9LEPT|nr:7TM diverse intracellular signaling domain-containing protein [Leptospira langatensis]TGJ98737.1 serine/threonine protein phosphatase [Leptospira langatensis]TGL40696.1 serine/threonine protein phosphatase [Leptospira langatensis]
MARIIRIVLFSVLLFSATPGFSDQEGLSDIVLTDRQEQYEITNEVSFYVDQEKKLKIEDILRLDAENQFKKLGKTNFGLTKFAYWIRIPIRNKSRNVRNWYLEVRHPVLDHVDFYLPSDQGYTVKRSGDKIPFKLREINHRNFIFELPLKNDQGKEETVFYIRSESESTVSLPIQILSEKTFSNLNSTEQFVFGIYYGLMFVMALYNLFIFFTVKDLSYFYYVVYISAFGLLQMSLNGLAFQYVWPNSIWLASYAPTFLIPLVTALAIMFSRHFLTMSVYLPRANKILLADSIFGFSLTIVSLFAQISSILWLIALYAMHIVPTLLACAVYALKKGYKPAIYYLIGWLTLLVGALLYGLKSFAIVPDIFVTGYGWQLGAGMEAILFSFALASRIKMIEKEKEDAQAKTLQIQKTLNDSLEILVHERTKTIEEQKLEIERKAKMIEKDLAIAAKIQISLLPSDPPKSRNVRIAYRCIPMLHVGGDFVELIADRTGRAFGVFICDVTGHGTGAAMVAAMVKMALADWVDYLSDPGHMLSKMRAQLVGKLNGNFLTATMITVFPESGRLLIANAGHPETIIIRKATGAYEMHRPSGVAINEFLSTPRYQTIQTDLSTGDKLVLYTDGLPEARSKSGEFYGEDRFWALLKENSQYEPERFCAQVIRKIQDFTEEEQNSHDDMAIVVLEYVG